jgi:hypothetical protein
MCYNRERLVAKVVWEMDIGIIDCNVSGSEELRTVNYMQEGPSVEAGSMGRGRRVLYQMILL